MEARVISVGNITLGGAGKTPVVAHLARVLQKHGYRVTVLSRGYRRRSRGVRIVSDGQGIRLNRSEAGDEPYLLARRLPGVPIVVGENRVSAGRLAIDLFGPDTLLLDDGFQHVRLHRDIDLVVIDASNPFGNGRVLPGGILREPIKSLHRAHLFWLTRVDQTDDLALLEKFLHALQPEAGIIQSTYRPTRLRSLETGAEADLSVLQGARTVMVCGIANPASFERTLLELGADLMERFSFPDHHPFKASEMREVQNAAATKGAKLIVTTEKDGVRIPRDIQYKVPVYELNIEVHIIQGKEFLEKALWNRTSMQSCPKRN